MPGQTRESCGHGKDCPLFASRKVLKHLAQICARFGVERACCSASTMTGIAGKRTGDRAGAVIFSSRSHALATPAMTEAH